MWAGCARLACVLHTSKAQRGWLVVLHSMARGDQRWQALDGWRGLSILFVLASHLLPLGPKPLQFNLAAGGVGMALFFVLSGFLVTQFLIQRADLRVFFVRRMARIGPLFLLYVGLAWWVFDLSDTQVMTTLSFVANLPPQHLAPSTEHLWSLCVEVQFYIYVALCSLFRRAWPHLILLAALVIFALRYVYGEYFSSITYFRGDEVLAGALLAFLLNGTLPVHVGKVRAALGRLPLWVPALMFLWSCHPAAGWFCGFRPYLALWLVGSSMVRTGADTAWLKHRTLKYLAEISYALYVIHPFLAHTWLGSGDVIEKYLKRPLLCALLWLLAHWSTFHFEARFTRWARSYRPNRPAPAGASG